MFSFASKMLNTIMGTEEGQQPGAVPGQQQHFGMQQARPLDGGYPQTRPSGQAPGVRPYGAPTFSGPRPNPGLVRGGPPAFGGPPRPLTGPGTPHRFNNGPQPLQSLPRGMQPQPGSQVPPQQFRGLSSAPPSMGAGGGGMVQGQGLGIRPQRPQQQQPRQPFQQQKPQPHLVQSGSGSSGPGPDLDLSHLSAEERAMIENVMAKAQQLEQEAPASGSSGPTIPTRRSDDQRFGPIPGVPGGEFGGRLCPLCRQRDISGRDGHPPQECAECRNLVCNRCGGIATHPETKRPEWTCGNCIKRRRVMAAGGNSVGQAQVIGQRQPTPYGAQVKPMGPTAQGEWETGRRGSGGSITQGQLQGGSPQHPNWTDDRLNFESEAEGSIDETKDWFDKSDQLRQHSPPVDLDLSPFPAHSFATDPSPSQSMSTNFPLASASIAKPSCVLLPCRSVSLDETDMGSPVNGYHTSPHPTMTNPPFPTLESSAEESQLIMEFNLLQSAVESYSIKRREQGAEPPKTPSPKLSPQKSFESLSPLPSPISLIQSPGDSPLSPDSKFPPQRKAIVVQEYELDNEYKSSSDEEASDSDSDDEAEHVTLQPSEATGFYDHSPGEVYTIPEEEDEGGSPTGGDLVSSLSRPGFQGDMNSPRRRMLGQECLPGQMIPPEHRQGQRPQLRPQRSLDNRILTSSSAPLANHQAGDKVSSQMEISSYGIPGMTMGQGQMAQMPQTEPSYQQQQPQQEQQQYDLQQHYGPSQFTQGMMDQGIPQQSPQPQHQMQSVQAMVPQQKPMENLNQYNANLTLSSQGQQTLTRPTSQQHQPMTHDPSPGLPTSQFQSYQPQVGVGIHSGLHAQPMPQGTPTSMAQPPQQYSPQQQQPQYQQQQPHQEQLAQPDHQQFQTFQVPQQQPTQQIQLQQQQQQQLQQQLFLQQQLQYQQQQSQSLSQQQQVPGMVGQITEVSGYGAEQWQGQGQDMNVQQSNLIASQFSPSNQPQNLTQTQQYQQQSTQQLHQLGSMTMTPGHGQPPNQLTGQPGGPGANKSISGLLADFSRALGLGTTSPRPSPIDEKAQMFPQGMPPEQSLSTYEQYFQPQGSTGLSQGYQAPFYTSPQSLPQSSAFTPIQDLSQIYAPAQNRAQQQYPYPNQPTSTQQLSTAFGTTVQGRLPIDIHSRTTNVQQQQYAFQPQVLTQAGMLTQQQAQSLGVGALSPAQAQMYQQQMALQHQAQHLKKTSRRAHLTGIGEMRRDGTATVLVPGQVGPGGMTIGALTPAVVTSLGTFIGGGPTILTSSLLQQPMAVTPLGTPVGTPRSGRDPGDSSDTMSETDSQKSLHMRRKLPCLPPDQEAAPLPSTKKRDRERAMEFRSLSPIRPSFETSSIKSYPHSSLGLSRPSASESNLRKMVSMAPDHTPRPGSALGLLQGSSVVSSIGGKMDSVYPLCGNLFSTSSVFPNSRLGTTTSGLPSSGGDFTSTTSGLYSTYKTPENWSSNIAELAACLPPDLRHLLNKDPEFGDFANMTSSLGDPGYASTQLPTFMKAIREQLQEERRQLLTEERRRLEALRERDRELGARVDAVTGGRTGSDTFQSRAESSRTVGLSRSAGASPLMSRKLKGHQRQLSDPKLSLPFSPIEEDGELQDFDRGAGILKYKSYNAYGSLDDVLGGDWDHSQSYLASSWAAAGGVLRETAINNMGPGRDDSDELRFQSCRYLPRRNSDGESWPLGQPTTAQPHHRRHHLRKHRKSRSWNPSPYVSEEEEEEDLSREEKKARIKAEIARRRQQLQERAGLHQELVRISRLREGPETEKHSVLKSVDQLLRDQYSYHDSSVPIHSYSGRSTQRLGSSGLVISPCASEEDKSIELIASTFRSDDYTSLLYEKLGEMSPMCESELGTELSNMAAMPLLEDMPTRSRRLLEDLHRSELVGYSGVGGGGTLKERSPRQRKTSPSTGPVPTSVTTKVVNTFTGFGPDTTANLCPTPDTEEQTGLDQKTTTVVPTLVPSLSSPVVTKEPGDSPGRRPSSVVSSFCKYPFDTKRILLTKDPKDISSGASSLGLKIVGGKELPFSGGRVAAYVAKIYDGPEIVGDVNEGDVVLEWNGLSLDNKTFEEVQTIVGNPEGEVELVLRCNYNIINGKARATGRDFAGYESSRDSDGNITIRPESLRRRDRYGSDKSRMSPKITEEGNEMIPKNFDEGITEETMKRKHLREVIYNLPNSPSTSTEATNTSTGTISIHRQSFTEGTSGDNFPTYSDIFQTSAGLSWKQKLRSTTTTQRRGEGNGLKSPRSRTKSTNSPCGQIKLQICHDPKASVLYVTVLKAKLTPQLLDSISALQFEPYVIVYLLPEPILENQRRTRHVRSSTPTWNQTMVYPNFGLEDLKLKFLELTVWNYNEGKEDEVIGKITLHLSAEGILDEQPHSYHLQMEERKGAKTRRRPRLDSYALHKKSSVAKRSSESASSRGSFLTAGGSDRRTGMGRLSLFSPSVIVPAKTGIPSDCRGRLCQIL